MTLKRVGRPKSVRSARRLVQAAGFVFYLLAVQALLTAGAGASVFVGTRASADLLLPAASFLLAVCYAVVGYHLRRRQLWARNFAFAFAGISLFAFPVGTGLGFLIVGFVASANRARVFPTLRRAPATESPLIRFEPDLVPELAAERAG
ncbi:MAG TPA: hypothetical protein VMN82_07015 [Thermoanaerobaculia bacterium]|nr:hypothetical protein [Thermoanaerobaculia bacterium]